MICRCVFDLSVHPNTVDASACDFGEHRVDAAEYWNKAMNRSQPLVNCD